MSTSEYLLSEISDLERNIYYADNNKLEYISTSEHLKSDPVEWTQQWEEIIDEVDKKLMRTLQVFHMEEDSVIHYGMKRHAF